MNGSGIDILLIEDNPSDVELVLRALKKNGVADNISILRDGEKALEYIFATGEYSRRNIHDLPRAIFLDLKLPKVDGLDVLQRIKSDHRTRTVPVIMMTSSQAEEEMVKSYDLG